MKNAIKALFSKNQTFISNKLSFHEQYQRFYSLRKNYDVSKQF